MTLDLLHFTPWLALAGGLLIGVSAALYMLGNGRIAGISGMLGRLIDPAAHARAEPFAFVAGLVAAPWVFRLFAPLPGVEIDASSMTLVAAGLLVGLGTRYASGCTSGHGVCGISRASARSFAATAVFMAFGFLTVFVTRHL
ncbi:YeeE/YedE family protein [Trinickia caryophylli]|uniref:Sulphur transport domain-containing protein n=1 Tax=Trinickia caryophylli TaxID=28094 RepID=A0A1X7CER6_TRICW|nr:YeeE/YedE family protein [Trinickia caryophylli]PMS12566.1 YeeE/YedE [Trinickia caryophylli]TRX19770.1 YeeE/YedE family protein [Trinickia caryophylli]WQE12907.1 YeeE/YedE family protein [Trinickia caryophylli]SME94970.1 hypothetical protein SAMN06295900_101249 [Trinickia caryophylli]GLU30632.1 hypothetical protein Busp01_04740 [Trinickia caryophylli]